MSRPLLCYCFSYRWAALRARQQRSDRSCCSPRSKTRSSIRLPPGFSSARSVRPSSDGQTASSSRSIRRVALQTPPAKSSKRSSAVRLLSSCTSPHPGAARRQRGCSSLSQRTWLQWLRERISVPPSPCRLADGHCLRGQLLSPRLTTPPGRIPGSRPNRLRRSQTRRCGTRRRGREHWRNCAGGTSNGPLEPLSRAPLPQLPKQSTLASST